jgi:uncharacterized protein YdeI (YjbR/CyaY-like superfamily)
MARRIGTPGGTEDKPALFFSGPEEFARWLERHHASERELWMGLYRKHVADRGLVWEDAVVEALRYGWIDSRAERIDAESRRQRWTPRRSGSNWSAINIATVERLIAEGRMTPAGLAAYERRRPDDAGYSYESLHTELPPEFAAELAADVAATAFWEAATASYRKIAVNWVVSAKQQATRERRMAQLVDDSANGRLLASQRYGTTPKWVERAAGAAQAAAGTSSIE